MTSSENNNAGTGTRTLPPVPTVSPDYMSYSRMNSILTCGEQFRLERVLKVPSRESWASVGGNAFHSAVEALLKAEVSTKEG